MKGWHVVVTRPQREKLAEGGLRRASVKWAPGPRIPISPSGRSSALPAGGRMAWRFTRRPSSGWFTATAMAAGASRQPVTRPLFLDYLFTHFDPMIDTHWARIFTSPGVRGMLTTGEMPARVPEVMIAVVRKADCELAAAPPVEQFAMVTIDKIRPM